MLLKQPLPIRVLRRRQARGRERNRAGRRQRRPTSRWSRVQSSLLGLGRRHLERKQGTVRRLLLGKHLPGRLLRNNRLHHKQGKITTVQRCGGANRRRPRHQMRTARGRRRAAKRRARPQRAPPSLDLCAWWRQSRMRQDRSRNRTNFSGRRAKRRSSGTRC